MTLFGLNNCVITIMCTTLGVVQEGEIHSLSHYALPRHYRLLDAIVCGGSCVDLCPPRFSQGIKSMRFPAVALLSRTGGTLNMAADKWPDTGQSLKIVTMMLCA